MRVAATLTALPLHQLPTHTQLPLRNRGYDGCGGDQSVSLTKYLTHYSTPYLREEEVESLLNRALRNVQIFKPYSANAIYVTEAVQPCPRQSYFNRLYPRPPTIASVLGQYLHTLLQEQFKSLGYDIEVGVGLDLGEFKLVGKADVVAEDEHGTHIVEIKSVGMLPNTPRETHIRQLQIYMQLLQAERGTLLYVSRNKGNIKLFDIKPDPQSLEFAITNARVLWEALNSRVPPPAHRGAWCVFCPHRKRCWLADRAVAV